ncbi:MAG: hypothetical protein R3C12_00645 [Planctomycetaceae bacterium]
MTVEQVIRAAISQIGTMLDVSGELHGIPSSYTHAWDWDLMVRDETVFITTKLQSNLHKVVRVYKLPKSSGLTTEALAACVKKTIRPWSWRDQIDKVIDIVEFDLPPVSSFPICRIQICKSIFRGRGVDFGQQGKGTGECEFGIEFIRPGPIGILGGDESDGGLVFIWGQGICSRHALHDRNAALRRSPTSTIEILPTC